MKKLEELAIKRITVRVNEILEKSVWIPRQETEEENTAWLRSRSDIRHAAEEIKEMVNAIQENNQ